MVGCNAHTEPSRVASFTWSAVQMLGHAKRRWTDPSLKFDSVEDASNSCRCWEHNFLITYKNVALERGVPASWWLLKLWICGGSTPHCLVQFSRASNRLFSMCFCGEICSSVVQGSILRLFYSAKRSRWAHPPQLILWVLQLCVWLSFSHFPGWRY